jgi:hypothetical protein
MKKSGQDAGTQNDRIRAIRFLSSRLGLEILEGVGVTGTKRVWVIDASQIVRSVMFEANPQKNVKY